MNRSILLYSCYDYCYWDSVAGAAELPSTVSTLFVSLRLAGECLFRQEWGKRGFRLQCCSYVPVTHLKAYSQRRKRIGLTHPSHRKFSYRQYFLAIVIVLVDRCMRTAPKCKCKIPGADRFRASCHCSNSRTTGVGRNLRVVLNSELYNQFSKDPALGLEAFLAPAEAQVSSLGQCQLLFISGPRFHIQDGPSPSLRPRRDSLRGSLSSRKPSCECRVHEHRPAP